MLNQIIETPTFVHSFAIKEKIYLLCDTSIQVYNKVSFEKEREIRIFEKEGKSRSLIMDDKYIYCKDFIDLYVLDAHSLKVVTKLKIGDDLKSDICGMCHDGNHLFVGVRNGEIAKIEKEKWANIEYFPISASSIWDMKHRDGVIYAGNVGGQLLMVKADSMEILNQMQAHKGNANSLCLFDSNLVTGGQDKKLILWDIEDLHITHAKKNVHKKAYIIGECYKGKILTICFRTGELKVWDSEKLIEENSIFIKPCLSGSVSIDDSYLYIASRAISGIERVRMSDVLQ